jgi:hypothetical protein
VLPSQNLRTVPDAPSLISLTHSISSEYDNKYVERVSICLGS